MSIYPVLSNYYDVLFPAKEATVEFLAERITPGGTLLDIGCGTGALCCALAERGFHAVGIDPDSLMIQKARDKVSGKNPEFYPLGMESISTLGKHFDASCCVGNTLVHLPDMEAVRVSFTTVYDILVPGGLYIVQIVNYDRILKDSVTSLPPLTGENVTLQRLYSITDGGKAILFEIQLEIREGGEEKILRDRVRLLPVKKEQLVDCAEMAGFSDIMVYGSFQGDSYSVDSSGTILTARK